MLPLLQYTLYCIMSLDKVVSGPRSKVSTTSNVDPSDARGSNSSTGIATECCVQVNLTACTLQLSR